MILTESAPIVVKYEFPDGFRDALHFASQAERGTWTRRMIEAECERRHDNWIAVLATPRPAPTAEEVQAQVASLVEQQTAVMDQIVALASPEVLVPILEARAVKTAERLVEARARVATVVRV